jgi:hypothetical protein
MEVHTMKKKPVDLSRSEQGQSLIIIAAVFVGLVALAGLAIDGGNLFVERRQAQNAADASAVAGTRLIAEAIQTCDAIDLAAFDLEVHRTINHYAEQNGVSDTNGVAGDEVNDNVIGYYVDEDGITLLGQVGAGTLPLGTAGVHVAVKDAHETFFLPVIGIKEIPSSAPAMALTGVIKQTPPGQPLLPIAIPQIVVDELSGGEEWELHDTSTPMDAKDGEFCYTDEGGTEHCIEDSDAPHNAQRGWLNLNHNFNSKWLYSGDELNRTFERNVSDAGCPNQPGELPGLKGYASGLCPYAYPIFAGTTGGWDGDFIHGGDGAKEAALITIHREVCTKEEPGSILAPVFDAVYLRDEMITVFGDGAESPDGYPNGGGFSSAGGGSSDSYYYHIVGYVEVSCGGKKDAQHTLSGTFQKAVIQGGIDITGYSGPGSCTRMLMGVALWE